MKICRTASDVASIYQNPNYEILGELLDEETDMCILTYRPVQDLLISAPGGCLPVALVTTARARMHLNNLLLQAEDRLIYCDTGQ